MKTVLSLTAAVCLAAAGCKQNTYTVTMEPVPAGMKRTLAWQREPTQKGQSAQAIPEAELKRVARLYDATPPDSPTSSATFSGTFAEALPADIGGRGWYATYPTSLGTLHAYMERFRGEPDLMSQWERRWRAIDAAVDVVLTWIDASLKGEAGAKRLRTFVDGDFRRDLKNAQLQVWLALERAETLATADESRRAATRAGLDDGVRLAPFLIERGYLTPKEAPALAWAIQHMDQDDEAALWDWARRQIVARMDRAGLDAVAAPPLSNASALSESFLSHLRTSAAARGRLEAWEKETGSQQEDPEAKFGALLAAAFAPGLLRDYDEVSVGLAAPVAPFMTNGTWTAEAQRVSWRTSIECKPEDAAGSPPLCYAFWTEPSPETQTAHFGRVFLTGEPLAIYCFWRAGLPRGQAERWDTLLESMRPNTDAEAQIEPFRSESGPAALLEALRSH
jgi:hypothetical protein